MSAAPGGRPDSPDPGPANGWRLARQRTELIAALDRLAEGTFARCDICGVQISDRRLRLAPAADRCMSHLPLARPRVSSHPNSDEPPGTDNDPTDGADWMRGRKR